MRPLIVIAVLIVAVFGWAEDEPRPDRYDHIYVTVLENGLTLVVVEAPGVPIVTIELAVRNGAFVEGPELNGLAHLYEHMFFKANETIPSQEEYLRRQRELGMVWNGTTSDERVNYFFTLQSHRLRDGLEFMNAAIRTPVFLEEELVREREVVLGEYDRAEADPSYYLWQMLDEMLWYEHPTRKDPLGDRDTIATATVDQMRWMQEVYYIPNNALLVLSGDVTRDEGLALVEDIFGDWEAGPDPFERYPIPEHPPLQGHVSAIVEQSVGVSLVALAWHGPDTRNDVDATYAADVLSFVVSQTDSGFQERLVESGLALQAGLSYATKRYVGPIYLIAATTPGSELEVIEALRHEITLMGSDDYFTDEQMQTAQTLLAVDDLYTQQRTDSLAHTLSYWWASADLDYYLGYIDALAAVERDDIQRYVHTYLQGTYHATVVMMSPEVRAMTGLSPEALIPFIVEAE